MAELVFQVDFDRLVSEDNDIMNGVFTPEALFGQIVRELGASDITTMWRFELVEALFPREDEYRVVANAFRTVDADVSIEEELSAFVQETQLAYDDGAAGLFNVTAITLDGEVFDMTSLGTDPAPGVGVPL